MQWLQHSNRGEWPNEWLGVVGIVLMLLCCGGVSTERVRRECAKQELWCVQNTETACGEKQTNPTTDIHRTGKEQPAHMRTAGKTPPYYSKLLITL